MDLNGRVYTAQLIRTSVSGSKTLVEFTAPSDKIVVLVEAWVTQKDSETSTQENISFVRKSAAGTGTSHTPRKHQSGDSAFGGTCRIDCTAEGTIGDEMLSEDFNIVGGYLYVPTPKRAIIVPGGGILGMRLVEAPEAGITVSAGMTFMEIG